MQDIIKSEMRDFILKSCREAVRDFSYRNDQMGARSALIIEKYFFEDCSIRELCDEFEMTGGNMSNIINRYLEHLSEVAKHGGYTSDEIDLISTILGARRSARKVYKECVKIIAQCKNRSDQKVVFSISDPIDKLCELNIISKRTLNSLRAEFEWSLDNHGCDSNITIANIVYVPKTWLYHVPNLGDKCIAELISFIDNYPIQGRIIPFKDDIRRVLKNANIDMQDDERAIVDAYYLTDMSVDTMCKQLKTNSRSIRTLIGRFLMELCEVVRNSKWDILDLITVSSMIDLYSARCGTYDIPAYFKCSHYIAGRIRDLY